MTTAGQRLAALDTLTAILRQESAAPWPEHPDAWEALLDLAAHHALLPAVWSAWRATGRPVLPDDAARALERFAPLGRGVPEIVLRRAYESSAARTERLLAAGVDVLRQLDAAGIPAVPLKGLHMLLAGVWTDPAARTMADLDVLVPQSAADDAFALLRAGSFQEHPEPIGEHADHHLPMLARGDVTLELHTELLVSRWSGLAPASDVLARASRRDTAAGAFVLASDTDTFVHLVAHAQLQDETYRLLGVPLRALFETALLLRVAHDIDDADVTRRFATHGVSHVLAAHLDASRRMFDAPVDVPSNVRTVAHRLAVDVAVTEPRAQEAWAYLTRLPGSFSESRMTEEFGPSGGSAWLWRARARHAGRRVRARLRERSD
ncbi:MAG: nucleotidyltransferase family protein [Acidimicrobiia bacterium]